MLPDDLAVALAALGERRPDAHLDVRWHSCVPSTMDAASALAHDGAPHGVVILADEQTAGRGRRGTVWASPPGAGLYFSFIARPGTPDRSPLSLLTLASLIHDVEAYLASEVFDLIGTDSRGGEAAFGKSEVERV